MWFAALESYDRNPWFERFLARLLEDAPAVTGLLRTDPFAGDPPRFVRALLYRYRFSDPATRAATGQWWTRELVGLYAPAMRRGAPLDGGRGASLRWGQDGERRMTHASLLSAILAALEHDPEVHVHQQPIRVTFDGTLRLEGEVADIVAKRKALRIAARVAGTESIDDRIRVRPGSSRSDADILRSALDALAQEGAFRNLVVRARGGAHPDHSDYIEVDVRDGVVRLAGDVGSLSHRRLAEVIAWWIPGSRDVDNRLRVHPPEQETDDEITDVVRLVLDKDPTIDAAQLRVTTRNHEITLEGVVHSEEIRHIAAEDCWYIPGVHAVHNRIQVRAG
jgi:osmotically-inducible protein OsmY